MKYGKSERYASSSGAAHTWIGAGCRMFAMYRHTPNPGHSSWIDFSYRRSLVLLAILSRRLHSLIPTRAGSGLLSLVPCVDGVQYSDAAKWLTVMDRLPYWFWPFSNGAMAGSCLPALSRRHLFGAHRWQASGKRRFSGLPRAAP